MTDVFKNLKSTANSIKTPALAVREFASALTRDTDGLVQGFADLATQRNGDLRLDLDAVVPSLANYRVTILSVQHPVSLYPAVVQSEHYDLTITEIADYGQLVQAIETVLEDKDVQQLLASLVAQASND